MTEKVLPYNRSIVPQETGYWCGPASAQVVLNSRGIEIAESALAREIGTTTRGTDYIGLIERVLDRVTPDAAYTSVYTERDPMTPAQKDALWRNLVASITAGYGVVMNWVAPPRNKPRGVRGSVSPRYSGGTTYHYVSAMGFYDGDGNPADRAVWIADSGFQPQGYWISFDQCATLIPPKGYCYAATTAAGPGPTPTQTPAAAILSKAMRDTVSLNRYAELLPAFSAALGEADCATINRAAMFSAQIGHECVGMKYFTELWGPTADQRTYQGRMGNTNPGDGYRYRGRGALQVTGKNNYRALSQWAHDRGLVDSPTFFVDDPDRLADDRYAFTGAIWYWIRNDLNRWADRGDIEGASRVINTGNPDPNSRRANGITDRIERWNLCRAMGPALLTLAEDWTPIYDEIMGVN